MIKRLLLSWLVNFLGLWAAASLLVGIQYNQQLKVLLIASLIFGIVNALVRPVVIILSLPAIMVTMGLFTLVINMLMLYITSAVYKPFQVNSIWAALGAVIIIWLVNYLMNDLLVDEKQKS
jgi:putative membrane protein